MPIVRKKNDKKTTGKQQKNVEENDKKTTKKRQENVFLSFSFTVFFPFSLFSFKENGPRFWGKKTAENAPGVFFAT